MITAGMAAMFSGGGNALKYGLDINAMFGNVVDGVLQVPAGKLYDLDFSGVESLQSMSDANYWSYFWQYRFQHNDTIRSVNFPDLKNVFSMNHTFEYCANLKEAHFNSVSSVSFLQSAFRECPSLTAVTFPELVNIGSNGMQYTFQNSVGLSSVDFPKLTTAGTSTFLQAFYGCSALTSVTFPELSVIPMQVFSNCFSGTGVRSLSFPKATTIATFRTAAYAPFSNCSDLTSLYFPAVNTIGTTSNNVFNGCTNLVEIHFGAANENTIKAMAGYASKWSAPNADC